jgi:hypothetical protein
MIARLIAARAILSLGPVTILLLSVLREKEGDMLNFLHIVRFGNKI